MIVKYSRATFFLWELWTVLGWSFVLPQTLQSVNHLLWCSLPGGNLFDVVSQMPRTFCMLSTDYCASFLQSKAVFMSSSICGVILLAMGWEHRQQNTSKQRRWSVVFYKSGPEPSCGTDSMCHPPGCRVMGASPPNWRCSICSILKAQAAEGPTLAFPLPIN